MVQWIDSISVQLQDAGSIPGLAQWDKGFGVAAAAAKSQVWLRSDPWPGNSICRGAAKKVKKKKKKKSWEFSKKGK